MCFHFDIDKLSTSVWVICLVYTMFRVMMMMLTNSLFYRSFISHYNIYHYMSLCTIEEYLLILQLLSY